MTHSIFRQNPDLVSRIIDDEIVIMIPGQGRVLGLNEVGSLIWGLVDGRNTKADILEAVCSEFDVSRDQAAADVDEFISLLTEKNLILQQSSSKLAEKGGQAVEKVY